MPFECRSAKTVDAGALRSGRGLGLAPEVVVYGIRPSNFRVPLAAEVCALLNGSCRRRKSEGCRADGKEGRELHVDVLCINHVVKQV